MRKQLSLLAVLLMSSTLVAGLASCGEEPSTSVKPTPEETPEASTPEASAPEASTPAPSTPSRPVYGDLEYDFEQEVTVKLYTTISSSASYGTTFDHYLEMFEQKYNNKIQVEHTRIGGYDEVRDTLKTELGAGEAPHIAYCYPDHVALYNKANAVQTLDKFIYNTQTDENGELLFGLTDEQINGFFPAYWEEGKNYGDGKMYTLPFVKSTEVLYYNKTVLEADGLEVPTHWFKDDEGLTPETSVEYVCEKLKELHPSCTPLGYDSEANWFITMAEQFGSAYTSATGEHYLFDNEVNRKFVEKFKGWYDKGYFTTQQLYGGYTSALFTNETDTSIPQAYLCVGSSAGASHQYPKTLESFEVGISALPQVNPSAPKAISQGPSLVMFKKASQQEVIATWLLMRFLTTDISLQAEYSMESGYCPSTKLVFENDIYNEWLDTAGGDSVPALSALSVKTCLDSSDMFFTSPAFVGSSDARDQVGSLMQAVFAAKVDDANPLSKIIDEAFKFAINECKEG